MSNSNKVKIALWSPFRGKVGTEKAVVNYARALKDIGYEIIIIQILDEFENYKDEFRLIRVWPKIMDPIGKTNFLFRRDFYILGLFSSRRLREIMNNENFDIAISFLMAVPFIKAIKHNKVGTPKIILSVQGFPKFLLKKDNLVSKLENKLRAHFWEKNYKFADKILLMTKHTERQLNEKFPGLGEKFTVLENPLFEDVVEFDCAHSRDCTRRIFFVGRYSYQKDFDLFAETTRILSQNPVLNLEFHVFGNFPEKIKNARENAHLIFRGYEQNFWQSLNSENDIHLITARWEDPGHALLEGLALGYKSIVADRDAPHVELARTFGILVAPPVPSAMALHVVDVIHLPQNNSETARLSHLVFKKYGLDEFKRKIANILREILLTER